MTFALCLQFLTNFHFFNLCRQDLILFFVVKKQKKLLIENKRMSDEMTTEMRHMIANVAHDLKTVNMFPLSLVFFRVICSSVSAAVRLHEWRRDG